MADLQNFSRTPGPAANLNVPTYEIAGQLVDGSDTLADFTGENTIRFPAVLSTLTVEQYAGVIDLVAESLIHIKAGL